jgi:hypothetical protein
MADPQGPNLEYRIRSKAGDWVWIEESPTVIRDGSGRAVEIINILRDVSDRKRAERAAGDIQSGMLLPRDALAGPVAEGRGRRRPEARPHHRRRPLRRLHGRPAAALLPGRRRHRQGRAGRPVHGAGQGAAPLHPLRRRRDDGRRDNDLGPSDDLGGAVAAIGAELSRNNSEAMAISMLVGLLDLATGRLQLVNAGHDDPVLILPDGQVVDLRLEGGPPLCAAEAYVYPVETHELPPGAALVCVTDGVTRRRGRTATSSAARG